MSANLASKGYESCSAPYMRFDQTPDLTNRRALVRFLQLNWYNDGIECASPSIREKQAAKIESQVAHRF